MNSRIAGHLLRLVAVLAIFLVMVAGGVSAQQGRPNGAGLVVRHGDGTLIYAYVEFEGETISGEELLLRAGLDLVVSPYAGIGTGVCMIGGEGCPADNCYCESYSNPAYFWHYYSKVDGGWFTEVRGPTVRQLADGDIDGWSWTAGDHGLPAVTIDEIAAINGFDRSPPPTATPPPPLPTPTPPPPPTATDTPVSPPTATATATAQPPTVTPRPTATDSPATTPTATPEPRSTATGTATASSTATPEPTATSTASATGEPSSTPSPAPDSPTPTPDADTSSGAVVVRPGATPEPLDTVGVDEGGPGTNLLLFSGFAAALAGAGALLVMRRKQGQAS